MQGNGLPISNYNLTAPTAPLCPLIRPYSAFDGPALAGKSFGRGLEKTSERTRFGDSLADTDATVQPLPDTHCNNPPLHLCTSTHSSVSADWICMPVGEPGDCNDRDAA